MHTIKHVWTQMDSVNLIAGNGTESATTEMTTKGGGSLGRSELVGYRGRQRAGTPGTTTLRFWAESTKTTLIASFTLTPAAVATTGPNGVVNDFLDIPAPIWDKLYYTLQGSVGDEDYDLEPIVRPIFGS